MEKRGLGRGLSALIPEMADEETAAGATAEIAITQIAPNPYQPRAYFDPEKMAELVASVREHGVLQPILVRPLGTDRYELIAGERRFRAAQTAGLTTIPALSRDMSAKEQLEIAVVENLQREDIGPMEAARAYRRLMDEFTMTQETVSARVGKSRSSIANTLRLLSLPEEAQDCVERGEISEGHARALLAAESDEAILHGLKIVIKKRLSVRDAEKLAKELRAKANGSLSNGAKPEKKGSHSENRSALDPNEADIADQLRQALGTKVSLRRFPGGGGKIEIEFFSAQEFERVIDLLLGGEDE